MQQISRNRLIGGIVLAVAGLLFVPAILTPESQPLDNPDFAINKPSTPVTTTVAILPTEKKPVVRIPEVPALELESLSAEAMDKPDAAEVASITTPENLVPAKPKQVALQPIKLESFQEEGEGSTKQRVAKPQKRVADTLAKVKPNTVVKPIANNKQESWIRVASFKEAGNADKLAASLKRKSFPVKIETVNVSGKKFRRVLVGPINSATEQKRILQQIRADGHQPRVQ